MSAITLDAAALYADLRLGVQSLVQRLSAVAAQAQPVELLPVSLVGIWSGGAWLAEQLQRDLGLPGDCGLLSIALHRDDYRSRGLAQSGGRTRLPFDIEGRHLVLVDDVLYTGRTIRAAVNELFDFGRPASVSLAVLVDRGGRELPIEPAVAAVRLSLPSSQRLSLARDEAGTLSFNIEMAG